MDEKDKERLVKLEIDYPGITETILRFDNAELPACMHCGSKDTASVQVGVVGRTIAIAGMSRKFFLTPNGPKSGEYYCRDCQHYFGEAATSAARGAPTEKAMQLTIPANNEEKMNYTNGATTLTVDYGYDIHSIKFPMKTYNKIVTGEKVSLKGQGFYVEGRRTQDYWDFNHRAIGSLYIRYEDGGEIYIGTIADGEVWFDFD